MKSLLLSFVFTLTVTLGFSQIVISEIMYNPPESNQDTLEYIEIYNSSDIMVDISGYHFLMGVEDTVAMGTVLQAGESYLFSESAQAMMNVFGVNSDQWTDGALSNGGETIVLADATGMMIDEVVFTDTAPWPTFDDGTDGEGASIELCNADSDNNLASNWRAANNDTGIMLNGKVILATPGSDNTVMCAVTVDHTVEVSSNEFTPADITINVGETVGWTNLGGNHNVNGTQATYPNNPESFGNGGASNSSWTYEYTFSTVGFYDYQCDPHVGLGMVGTITVIDPNAPEFPDRAIGDVTTVDADGVTDSLFVNCTLEGIVHSINFRPNGLTFALIDDSNNGINVFSNSDNFGYNVAEGDVLRIAGEIGQFNGLTQIVPVSVEMVGTDNLFDPTEVNDLNEDSESQLVMVLAESIDESQWAGDGSSFNVDATLINGTSVVIRIDSDTDLASMAVPPCGLAAGWQIVGIGGQFDGDVPYDSGYQLLPRYADDISCITSNNDLLLDGPIAIAPNPSSGIVNVNTEVEVERIIIFDMLGKIVKRSTYSSQIDISNLEKGMYQMTFVKGDRTHTASVIKE